MENQKFENVSKALKEIDEILVHNNKVATSFQDESLIIRKLHRAPGRIALQPSYVTDFFGIQTFVEIALKNDLRFYITLEPNLNEKPAPVLNIYSHGTE